jgi:hypothetical protein
VNNWGSTRARMVYVAVAVLVALGLIVWLG